jgi:hypothetical protein
LFIPFHRSSSNDKYSPDSGTGNSDIEDFVTRTRDDADIVILCDSEEDNAATDLARRIKDAKRQKNNNKDLRIGTVDNLFHYEGMRKVEVALSKTKWLIIYATPKYAANENVIQDLHLVVGTKKLSKRVVMFVPKGEPF